MLPAQHPQLVEVLREIAKLSEHRITRAQFVHLNTSVANMEKKIHVTLKDGDHP
jgi:hypothetical protein